MGGNRWVEGKSFKSKKKKKKLSVKRGENKVLKKIIEIRGKKT
jgi:hypothetical protein